MPNFPEQEDDSARPLAPWFLKEWMLALGRKQAQLQTELNWSKGNANALYHGTSRYQEHRIAEAADWLGIEPYELLMHPTVALSIRRLRQSAEAIASDRGASFKNDLEGLLPATKSTGRKA